jgi:hypothetical protein
MYFLIVLATLMVAIAVVVILKIHDADEISFKIKGKKARNELHLRPENEDEQRLVRRG